ncbi:hypothetical protein IMCC20628_02536 [Hoeflea sp. IMCC20628]|uniref:hypothetical protein n=1 Tax=Hoeflea sp. IMCC20628 TaxID=1620421 RepID=UPI00063AEB2B|nr:hypothetical protein [Hoeflea sp. IMCC20628]AKI01234.1 hypothetical protein IMCC20628_02536 [Hoeflea sp. IMCC20628]
MPLPNQSSTAALSVLIILQTVMLSALYAGVPPHPPVATPLFGIAPFLGAAISAAVAAMLLGSSTSQYGRGLSLLATVMALVSFGPQKYFDAQFGLIWPAVIGGQLASLALLWGLVSGLLSGNANARQEETQ